MTVLERGHGAPSLCDAREWGDRPWYPGCAMDGPPPEMAGMAGRPLPSGPGELRTWFRKAMRRRKGDPVRAACEEWATARAKSGPEFAVPADWFPLRRPRWSRG